MKKLDFSKQERSERLCNSKKWEGPWGSKGTEGKEQRLKKFRLGKGKEPVF